MNQLKVNQRETISVLNKRGWSARRIARELGFDRDAVSRYIRLEEAAKPATPSPGSTPEHQPEKLPAAPQGEAKCSASPCFRKTE
jgi:transposase